jgi:methyl-accepting chemotaxis protein
MNNNKEVKKLLESIKTTINDISTRIDSIESKIGTIDTDLERINQNSQGGVERSTQMIQNLDDKFDFLFVAAEAKENRRLYGNERY